MPSFLQAVFLSGLAALAVPILIHLFFRLKTKRVELGTLRFLRIVLEENARRRKVMRWFLLALRMALVALLAMLFARPYFTSAATGNDKELVVVLIDRSATMQLKGEQGRLIDQAMAEAQALIDRAGRGARVEVAFFDHQVHPLRNPETDPGARAELPRLASPQELWGATNYGAAFGWARDILIKSAAVSRQLHLFTDLQQSGLNWTEVEPLPAGTEAHLHDLGRAVVNNLAVTEVRVPRTWIRPDESTRLQAALLHGGSFAQQEVSVVVEIGRAPAATPTNGAAEKTTGTATDFSKLVGRITLRERVKLEPGATVLLDFDLPELEAGLWRGRVFIEHEDDLPFDNERYFAISAAPPYRVLVASGQQAGNPLLSETYFLEAVLRLAPPGEMYAASPFAPDAVSLDGGGRLPVLDDHDAVILADVAGLSHDELSRLASFVKAGGGLLVFTGELVTPATGDAFRAAGLDAGTIGEPRSARDLPWRLSRWDEKHPIFQPMSDPQHGDLRRWKFSTCTPIEPAADAQVLAEFSSGLPAILERQVGEGRVLWVATSCGRRWGDWNLSRMYLPAIHQLLGYEVGLAQGGRVRSQLVDAGEPEAGAAAVAATSGDLPGIRQFPRFAAVTNVSPRESETERCSQQDFEDRFAVKFLDETGTTDAGAEAAPAGVEFQQDELWPWVACGLLCVLLLEGFVGNRTTA